MQEMWIQPRVGKIPLEKEMVTYSVFLPGKSHGQRSLADYNQKGHRRVEHDLATEQQESPQKEYQYISLKIKD